MVVLQPLHQQRCVNELAVAYRPPRVPHVTLIFIRSFRQIRTHPVNVNLQHAGRNVVTGTANCFSICSTEAKQRAIHKPRRF